jgi:hypothetical protein
VKRLPLVVLAAVLSSCAWFAYGTGRFNPIIVLPEARISVSKAETHYVTLELQGQSISGALPAPNAAYGGQLKSSGSKDLRFSFSVRSSVNVPSDWNVGVARATLEGSTTREVTLIGSDSLDVLTRLRPERAEVSLSVRVPTTANPRSYVLEGRLIPDEGGVLPLRITATVIAALPNTTPLSSTLSVNPTGSVTLVAGGTYTLVLEYGFSEVWSLGRTLTRLYASALNFGNTSERVVSGGWSVTTQELPVGWSLNLLETTLWFQIERRARELGGDLVNEQYTLRYERIGATMALYPNSTTPEDRLVSGQLNYASRGVQPFRWTVSVRP